jgi:prevent-host-death family protein
MLSAALKGKRTPIKAALLDQRIVAGLGNIYVCEAMFRARISPLRLAYTVPGARAARLVPAIKATLTEAIAAGGSSLRVGIFSTCVEGLWAGGGGLRGLSRGARVCGDQADCAVGAEHVLLWAVAEVADARLVSRQPEHGHRSFWTTSRTQIKLAGIWLERESCMKEIGAFEAKNKFSQLLDWVESGEEIRITRHGKEVARLVPASGAFNREAARSAAERIRAMSKGVTLGGLKIKDLINEGRH